MKLKPADLPTNEGRLTPHDSQEQPEQVPEQEQVEQELLQANEQG